MTIVQVVQKNPKGEWYIRETNLDSILAHKTLDSCYIFLPKNGYPARESDRRALLQTFNVALMAATQMCLECNGFFGSTGTYNDAGHISSYSTWSRCLVKSVKPTPQQGVIYHWNEMTFFTRWTASENISICIDTPDDFPRNLKEILSRDWKSLDPSDPFALHVPLMDQVIQLYDRSVWGIRDLIRQVEVERERNKEIEADFSRLHEISRHAIHSTETLSVTTQTMEAMHQRHKEFFEDANSVAGSSLRQRATQQYMEFQTQLVRNLKHRSNANKERLQNEITLAYNMIAQRDSKVMVEVGKATKSDSSAMKAVAFVTMAFLPATFTSAIFSMSFFNFSPDSEPPIGQWRVSGQIWIYWVIAIPLTGLTVLTSLWWQGKLHVHNTLRHVRANRAENLRMKV